ncbi:MAG: AEC family transporter [Clostridiales Family XIII bacterium]|jgi:predicted permease|nr:AEC family transporter [Clostridiales Family XIII bacterium]
MVSIFIKIISIFVIVLIGYLVSKVGWLPVDSSKYLSKVVVNIAAPCAIVSSLSQQNLDAEGLGTLFMLSGFSIVQFLFCLAVALLFLKVMKVEQDERCIYKNAILFSNCGFMGFPVALAIFGAQGLFYQVLINCIYTFFMFTVGVSNVRPRSKHSQTFLHKIGVLLRDIISLPVISMVIGMVILLLHIPVSEDIISVLDMLGSIMTPLSMMVIGIQLTESKVSDVLHNKKLILVSALRLIILPGLFFLAIVFLPISKMAIGVLTMNLMLPVAAVTVVLAEEYGRNVKLAAEGTFLSTLFSMATIPVAALLLSMYVAA